MSILNKRTLFIFICLLNWVFTYAESGTLGYFVEPYNPHHEYYFNNNGNRSRYRIQMHTPHYAFCIDTETCCCYEYFPNYEWEFQEKQAVQFFKNQILMN